MNKVHLRLACAGVPTTQLRKVFVPAVAWFPYVDSSSAVFCAAVITAVRRNVFWSRYFANAANADVLVLYCPPERLRRGTDRKRAILGLAPSIVATDIPTLQEVIARLRLAGNGDGE